MNRDDKQLAVAEVKKSFLEYSGTFLINFKGLSVSQMEELRSKVRSDSGCLKVVKARLMKIAAEQASDQVQDLGVLKEEFKDQVALVFAPGEQSTVVAKHLVDFGKTNEQLKIIAGICENKFISSQQVIGLASIPAKDVLLAQVAMVMQAPVVGFARSLKQVLTKVAYVLQKVHERVKDS